MKRKVIEEKRVKSGKTREEEIVESKEKRQRRREERCLHLFIAVAEQFPHVGGVEAARVVLPRPCLHGRVPVVDGAVPPQVRLDVEDLARDATHDSHGEQHLVVGQLGRSQHLHHKPVGGHHLHSRGGY